MGYNNLLNQENISSNYLAIMRPRRKIEMLVNEGGGIYSAVFSLGEIVGITVNGVALALGSSSALSAGQFFFDIETNKIYIRKSDSTSPASDFLVATYEIFIGTYDAHFYKVPTDSNSRVVYFDPVITRSPKIKNSLSDVIFGFMPVQNGNIALTNAEHWLENHVYESSFNRAEIDLYHWLGGLDPSNVKLILKGLMSNVDYSRNEVTIQIYDRIDRFNDEFRNVVDSFYKKSIFANLDPLAEENPIRQIYGVVDGLIPVNIDYVLDNPTTSQNRKFIIGAEPSILGKVNRTVASGSTTTRTQLGTNGAKGIRVGDMIKTSTAAYIEVTGVDPSYSYVDHAALGSPLSAGVTIERSFASRVEIDQNGKRFLLFYGRDYVELTGQASGTYGFQLTDNFEASLSMETFSPNDRIFCRVYGGKNSVTLSSLPVGSDSDETQNLTNPIAILVDIIKRAGFIDDDFDASKWLTLAALAEEEIGFVIPKTYSGGFPAYKDLIIEILNSFLGRLYIDDALNWSIFKLGPVGAIDNELSDDEIIRKSLDYSFDYSDLVSDIFIEYGSREVGSEVDQTDQVFTASYSSNRAKFLHKISKQKTFRVPFFRVTDAERLARRLSYILGERKGQITIQSVIRLFPTTLEQILAISPEYLPKGDGKFLVEGLTKSLKSITIEANDNKGIKDNSSSW